MNLAMKWIDQVRGTDSLREVARRAKVHQATLNRQVNLDLLTFEMVRDVSRAYGRSVLADLIATGHLATSDAGVTDITTALRAATDEQLVVEVGRRLGVVSVSALFDSPISDAVAQAGELIEGRFGVGGSEEDHQDADEQAAAKPKSRDRGEEPETP